MRNNKTSIRFHCQLNPKNHAIQQFYDPLTPTQLVKKKPVSSKNVTSYRTLFDQNDSTENIFDKKINQLQQDNKMHNQEEDQPIDDMFLKRMIANKRNPKKSMPVQRSQDKVEFQAFNFDKKIQVKYPQTPHFKNQLLSPFWKFNKDNKFNIESLQKNTIKSTKIQYSSIQLDQDPLLYVTEPSKYFIGIAMKMKQNDRPNQMMMFLKLACYTQPFSQKPWKKYLEMLDSVGRIRQCLNYSKTAFIFNSTEEFAKSYLTCGQKCGLTIDQLKGMITSVNNPEIFEKGVLVQMAKLCLKYKQSWQGLKILLQICIWNQFRLPVCSLIHFVSRFLENIGQRQKAYIILKKSFGKNMSKLEIYTLYLEMKNRQLKGNINEQASKQVISYVQFVSGENRYKLYLQVAQIQFRQGKQTYKKSLEQAYFCAKNYCASGTGCNKALRHIFFSVLRWKKIIYQFPVINDITIFQNNRQLYITGKKFQKYEYSDWKYFLHYGLQKNQQILAQASKKWPYTGRLIAQWTHCLRLKLPILQVLRIWRQKIKQVPKSGQLWCQGGRIYAELKDYENASKCFRAAIHFTPQYGDSFIEQLKVLLIKGKFRQIQKLKKILLVSEPFYGHVWSFLKCYSQNYRLSFSDLWNIAISQIKNSLYAKNLEIFKSKKSVYCQQLTALASYNSAVLNPSSQQIRVKLFHSYEQIESRG